ncbi:ArsR/SmtB family transcription factor [Albimonas donghaensis]|nr:helix-turn-helix domain-containing protein [Albimonas donghaensis]
MSEPSRPAAARSTAAMIFAALGHPARLALFEGLADGRPRSIKELTWDLASDPLIAPDGLTRQGVTRHLAALEGAGLVEARRAGRERRFALRRQGAAEAQVFLRRVETQWDAALQRLAAQLDADVESVAEAGAEAEEE